MLEEDPALTRLREDFLAAHDNRYTIARELGEGASGRAYLANDLRRRVEVCIKLYHEGVAAKGSDRDWHVTSTLKHPAVADTFTVEEFQSGGRRCSAVVSRFIRGHNLMRVLHQLERAPDDRRVELSLALLESLREDLCEGIKACHEAGFGHGDLHPRNVIVCQRVHRLGAVIIDFDNATVAASSAAEDDRRAKDLRSLRRLVGMITHGWKWHDALQRLLDFHASVDAFRGALGWSLHFLMTADGRSANKVNLNSFVDALYHHHWMDPAEGLHAEVVLETIELLARDLGLRAEFEDAKRTWQQRTRNRFTWRIPPRDPNEPIEVDPPLAELWRPLNEEVL